MTRAEHQAERAQTLAEESARRSAQRAERVKAIRRALRGEESVAAIARRLHVDIRTVMAVRDEIGARR